MACGASLLHLLDEGSAVAEAIHVVVKDGIKGMNLQLYTHAFKVDDDKTIEHPTSI